MTADALVGRGRELDALRDRVLRGDRLVVVVGPPGVGKSRLARELAASFDPDDQAPFGDRIWRSSLSQASGTADLISALVDSLTVDLGGVAETDAALQRLVKALAGRGPQLLLLDDVDRVIDATAQLVRALAAAPNVQLMLTSRERLPEGDAATFTLGPLRLAPAGASRAALLETPAVTLFVERARMTVPADELVETQLTAIGELTRRLDGFPLAIELAAARARVLDPINLLDRLDRRLDLLRRRSRSSDTRHSSLRAAIDESWAALSPAEQLTFAQCAVFAGGFDVSAAETVVDLGSDPGGMSIVDCLGELRDKSLIAHGQTTDGHRRLYLYETLQLFAAEKLAELGLEQAAIERHISHYAGLGEEASAADADNLRIGLERACERVAAGDEAGVDELIDIALVNDAFQRKSSPLAAWTGRLAEVESFVSSSARASSGQHVRLLIALGSAKRGTGQADAAETALRSAISLAEQLGDRRLVIAGRVELGVLLSTLGRGDETLALANEGLEQARQINDRTGEGMFYDLVGSCAIRLGKPREARLAYSEALERLKGSKHVREVAAVLINIGHSWIAEARPHAALAHYRRALPRVAEADHRARARFMTSMGRAALEAGDLEMGRQLLGQTLERLRELVDPMWEGYVFTVLASIELESGAHGAAETNCERALVLFRGLGEKTMLASTQLALGRVRWDRGDHRSALESIRPAIAWYREAEQLPSLVIAQSMAAASLACLGELDQARELIEDVAEHLQHVLEIDRILVAVHRCQIDLVEAAELETTGRSDDAAALRRSVDQRVVEATRVGPVTSDSPWGAPSLAMRCHELRIALRNVTAALTRRQRQWLGAEALDPDGEALIVERGCHGFRAPGSPDRQDLSRKGTLRLLVQCLVERRRGGPAQPITAQELIEAAWTDEKILPDAAAARLHVNVSRLRKLGLADVLVFRDGGYLLDPRMPVIVAD